MKLDYPRLQLRLVCHLALSALLCSAWAYLDDSPGQYAWATPSDDDDDDDGDGELFELEGDDDDDDDDDDFGSSTVEMGSSPVGSSENPDSVSEFGGGDTKAKERKKKEPEGYPIQVARRPLTLEEGMFQLALRVPAFVSPASLSSSLHLDFGITDDIQIGMAYGPGTLGGEGYIVGKGFHVQARYRIFDWLSAEATVPMFADPFSIGLSLAAPMIFRLGDKAAIVIGHELFHVRIFRFIPALADAVYNEEKLAEYDTNQIIPLGELRFLGGIIYQVSDKLAVTGDSGIIAFNYGLTDAGVPLRVTATYSPSNKIDLGARLGFDNLDQATESFNLYLSAVLRI